MVPVGEALLVPHPPLFHRVGSGSAPDLLDQRKSVAIIVTLDLRTASYLYAILTYWGLDL
eukprot:COSAG02_NODE_331_length_24480_cov_22.114720_3_plen_60_part_00